MEKLTCVLCGAPADYESMTMPSPICKKCAEEVAEIYAKNNNVVNIEDLIEELFVPAAGDITEIRNQ